MHALWRKTGLCIHAATGGRKSNLKDAQTNQVDVDGVGAVEFADQLPYDNLKEKDNAQDQRRKSTGMLKEKALMLGVMWHSWREK